MCSAHGVQKRVLDNYRKLQAVATQGLSSELTPDPMQEKQVLLAPEPLLQSQHKDFVVVVVCFSRRHGFCVALEPVLELPL